VTLLRALGVGLLSLLLGAAPAVGAERGVDVTASCERKAARGRVVCDVEMEVTRGRIAWADVVVVTAPPFAPPLLSRVGMADARSRTDRRIRIPVAFVATSQGRGTVEVRARVVVCEVGPDGTDTCRPATRGASAELVVGTDVVR
jgi:hypothetical protein